MNQPRVTVPVRFAIVGCGHIGRRHMAVLDAEPRAELVAVCDVDDARLPATTDGVGRHTDYAGVLASPAVDVVSICTPHFLHAQMTIAAAEAGKHILVEKPMALSSADARAMIESARSNSVVLSVVKQNRYNTPVLLAKRALDEGRLGRIFMVQCSVLWNRTDDYYRQSPWRGKRAYEGGALFTQASHFIDLLTWWFGGVVAATGSIATRNHKIDLEDCGSSALQFSSGVLGTVVWTTCTYRANFEGSITIIGEKGTIKIGGQYLNTIDYWDVQDYALPAGIAFTDQPNVYPGYQGSSSNHDKVIRNLIAAVLRERSEMVDGADGLLSVEAIELIYRNAMVLT